MSKDLLKEAIADAKAVRETAIANAKLALEEAFAPKLQSMLSTKIREEFEDEEEVEVESADAAETEELPVEESDTDDELEIESMYAEDADAEVNTDELEEDEDEDLELESILRELEDGTEADEDFPDPTAEDPSLAEESEDEEAPVAEDDSDEEFDLEEVINALREEDEEEAPVDEADTEDDLEEAYATIKFLRSKINEVNLLNAKLLFSNKLFRANNLNETQKLRIIETFDRAASVREVKLVYSTLAESMVGSKSSKSAIAEGFASKATKSTAPNKSVIVESNDFSNRMRQLAGLI
jgi:hypothetical protein